MNLNYACDRYLLIVSGRISCLKYTQIELHLHIIYISTFYESIVRCIGHASAKGVFDRSVAIRDNH